MELDFRNRESLQEFNSTNLSMQRTDCTYIVGSNLCLAKRESASENHVSHVIECRSRIEMLRIYARRIAAFVKNKLSVWYRAVRQNIRKSVGVFVSSWRVKSEEPVTTAAMLAWLFNCSFPEPTCTLTAERFYLHPETFNGVFAGKVVTTIIAAKLKRLMLKAVGGNMERLFAIFTLANGGFHVLSIATQTVGVKWGM